MIDAMLLQHVQFQTVIMPLIIWAGIQLVQAVVGQYAAFINTVHQQHLTDYLSLQVLNKAVSVKYDYYENPAYHDTLHLAQQQVIYKTGIVLTGFNAILLNSLSLCFLFGFLFSLIRLERKLAPEEREAHYLHYILTSVSHAKEVRIFGFGEALTEKFKLIRAFIHQRKKDLYKKNLLYSMGAEVLEVTVITVILIYMAQHVWGKLITVSVFIIYLQGFRRLQNTSRSFLQALVQLFQQRIFLRDLFVFLDLPLPESPAADHLFTGDNSGLRVSNISFHYPQTTHAVLKNISFHCVQTKVMKWKSEQ
jgi:ATP-binding cassette subfamily B protein